MRVLIVSHAAVVDVNQQLWNHLALQPDLDVALIAPASWPTELRGNLSFQALPGLTVRPFVLRPWLAGTGWRMHLALYPDAWRALHDFRPHVVHVDEEPYALATLQLTLLARIAGARVLFKSYQTIAKRFPAPFGTVERVVFALADGALPGTPRVLRVLRAKGYRGPAHVVPFAFDTERFSPSRSPVSEGRQRRRSSPDSPWREATSLRARLGLLGPTVGYLGRLAAEKGVFELIQAVALLRAAGMPVQALIVGGGPAAEQVRCAVRDANLMDQIRLLPAVPHSQVADYYRAADVIAVPSRTTSGWSEQFGRVAAEALACGVPVVASDSGELPYLVRPPRAGGLVVAERNPRALAAALAALLGDADRSRRLGAQGRAWVSTELSFDAVAQRLRLAYLALGADCRGSWDGACFASSC